MGPFRGRQRLMIMCGPDASTCAAGHSDCATARTGTSAATRCNGRCRAGDAEASPSRSSLSVCPRRAQTSLACSALSQAQPAAMAAAGWSWCVSRFRRPTPLASARQNLLKKARIVDLRDEKVRHNGAVNCMAGSKTTSRENHGHHATRCLRGFGRASCGAPDLGPMISRRRFDGGFCQGTRRTMRCLITAWLQVRVLPGQPDTKYLMLLIFLV
jgi:hypothetical protein